MTPLRWGLGSLAGAIVGGLVIGVVNGLISAYLSTDYRLSLVFLLEIDTDVTGFV